MIIPNNSNKYHKFKIEDKSNNPKLMILIKISLAYFDGHYMLLKFGMNFCKHEIYILYIPI